MKNPPRLTFRCPRIAVFFDLAVESARGILRGFMAYIRLNAPWNVHFVSKTVNDVDPTSLVDWNGDGILAHLPNQETLETILSKKCPTVLLARDDNDRLRVKKTAGKHAPVFVRCDNLAIGKMAADYFLKKDFAHFAYVSYSKDVCWCEERRKSFTQEVEKRGFSVDAFLPPDEKTDWFTRQNLLREWLLKLPKPVAILTANDVRGRQVLEVCQQADIPVPYEASVLGIDNDLTVCEMCWPSLSSIQIDWERAGSLCAESLDCMMQGETPPVGIYGPLRVVSRNSTEFFHVSDRLVVQVLEIIRISRGENLRVCDIIESFPVSERTLQERFKKAVGRSIMEEIKRVRLQNICRLIEETDLSFHEIARSFGFENANHLGQLFKKELGITMGEYRREKK
ncbi:MAG: XylR family transcriptional regulator [Planctomycetia bacterium]|nr:XylR family transcriptional regulator [Planctomycetia bacterium]